MTMTAPGMTTANAFQSKPASFKGAMLFYGFYSILRAGRCKPAVRTQQRRYKPLIKLNQSQKEPADNLLNCFHLLFLFPQLPNRQLAA